MSYRRKRTFGCALILSLVAVLGPGAGSAPRGADALKSRLRDALQLTEEQQVELFPLVDRLFDVRAERARQRRDLLATLRRQMSQGASDAAISSTLDALERQGADSCSNDKELLGEIDARLSVRQRASFRIESERFRARAERRVREQRDPSARAPGGTAPDPEEPRR
jgi:hypothetical protein